MNISAAATPATPKLPAAPASADTKPTAAGESPFHALFKGTQAAHPAAKPARGEKATAKKGDSDTTKAAILPVFDAIKELLAFGSPQEDGQAEPAAAPILPDIANAAATPKVITLFGSAIAQQLTEKSAIQVPQQPHEQVEAKAQQPAFDLKLAVPKPAQSQEPSQQQTSQQETPQREPAAPPIAPVILPAKAAAEVPAASAPKIEPLFNPPATEPVPQARPQVEAHAAQPAPRIERPSEVLPIEPRPIAVSSPREITVRLADLQDRATDVRFVERAGQVHVSVRTSDADFGRTLRSGLNDLITRLDHAGIRAELSRGSDGAAFKNNSRSTPDEQNGSGARRDQQQRQPQGNARGWMEEFQKQSNSDGDQSL